MRSSKPDARASSASLVSSRDTRYSRFASPPDNLFLRIFTFDNRRAARSYVHSCKTRSGTGPTGPEVVVISARYPFVACVGWTCAACFVCSHTSPNIHAVISPSPIRFLSCFMLRIRCKLIRPIVLYHPIPPSVCTGPLRPHQASLWVGSCLSENYF